MLAPMFTPIAGDKNAYFVFKIGNKNQIIKYVINILIIKYY